MSDQQTDAEVIASLGLGARFLRRRKPTTSTPAYRPRWTDSDNLHGREALVVGGPSDGLRIVVREKSGHYRYPDVLDLSAYTFDPTDWVWRLT